MAISNILSIFNGDADKTITDLLATYGCTCTVMKNTVFFTTASITATAAIAGKLGDMPLNFTLLMFPVNSSAYAYGAGVDDNDLHNINDSILN